MALSDCRFYDLFRLKLLATEGRLRVFGAWLIAAERFGCELWAEELREARVANGDFARLEKVWSRRYRPVLGDEELRLIANRLEDLLRGLYDLLFASVELWERGHPRSRASGRALGVLFPLGWEEVFGRCPVVRSVAVREFVDRAAELGPELEGLGLAFLLDRLGEVNEDYGVAIGLTSHEGLDFERLRWQQADGRELMARQWVRGLHEALQLSDPDFFRAVVDPVLEENEALIALGSEEVIRLDRDPGFGSDQAFF